MVRTIPIASPLPRIFDSIRRMIERSLIWPALFLVSLGTCWALRLLAIKLATQDGADTVEVVLMATASIVAITAAINFARSKLLPLSRSHLQFYALAGLFGFGAPFLAEVAVAPHLPALLFVIVVATTPIWVVCISALTNLEQLTLMRVLGVVGGFAAVLLIVLATHVNQFEQSGQVNLVWVLAAFGIPLLYALYILYVASSWPADLDNLQGAQGQGFVALISFLCIWIITGEGIGEFASSIELWPVAMVVVAEVIGLVLLFQIARSYGGNFVSQANYVSIVVGAIISVIFFGQAISLGVIFGIVLLLLSMWVSLRAIDAH